MDTRCKKRKGLGLSSRIVTNVSAEPKSPDKINGHSPSASELISTKPPSKRNRDPQGQDNIPKGFENIKYGSKSSSSKQFQQKRSRPISRSSNEILTHVNPSNSLSNLKNPSEVDATFAVPVEINTVSLEHLDSGSTTNIKCNSLGTTEKPTVLNSRLKSDNQSNRLSSTKHKTKDESEVYINAPHRSFTSTSSSLKAASNIMARPKKTSASENVMRTKDHNSNSKNSDIQPSNSVHPNSMPRIPDKLIIEKGLQNIVPSVEGLVSQVSLQTSCTNVDSSCSKQQSRLYDDPEPGCSKAADDNHMFLRPDAPKGNHSTPKQLPLSSNRPSSPSMISGASLTTPPEHTTCNVESEEEYSPIDNQFLSQPMDNLVLWNWGARKPCINENVGNSQDASEKSPQHYKRRRSSSRTRPSKRKLLSSPKPKPSSSSMLGLQSIVEQLKQLKYTISLEKAAEKEEREFPKPSIESQDNTEINEEVKELASRSGSLEDLFAPSPENSPYHTEIPCAEEPTIIKENFVPPNRSTTPESAKNDSTEHINDTSIKICLPIASYETKTTLALGSETNSKTLSKPPAVGPDAMSPLRNAFYQDDSLTDCLLAYSLEVEEECLKSQEKAQSSQPLLTTPNTLPCLQPVNNFSCSQSSAFVQKIPADTRSVTKHMSQVSSPVKCSVPNLMNNLMSQPSNRNEPSTTTSISREAIFSSSQEKISYIQPTYSAQQTKLKVPTNTSKNAAPYTANAAKPLLPKLAVSSSSMLPPKRKSPRSIPPSQTNKKFSPRNKSPFSKGVSPRKNPVVVSPKDVEISDFSPRWIESIKNSVSPMNASLSKQSKTPNSKVPSEKSMQAWPKNISRTLFSSKTLATSMKTRNTPAPLCSVIQNPAEATPSISKPPLNTEVETIQQCKNSVPKTLTKEAVKTTSPCPPKPNRLDGIQEKSHNNSMVDIFEDSFDVAFEDIDKLEAEILSQLEQSTVPAVSTSCVTNKAAVIPNSTSTVSTENSSKKSSIIGMEKSCSSQILGNEYIIVKTTSSSNQNKTSSIVPSSITHAGAQASAQLVSIKGTTSSSKNTSSSWPHQTPIISAPTMLSDASTFHPNSSNNNTSTIDQKSKKSFWPQENSFNLQNSKVNSNNLCRKNDSKITPWPHQVSQINSKNNNIVSQVKTFCPQIQTSKTSTSPLHSSHVNENINSLLSVNNLNKLPLMTNKPTISVAQTLHGNVSNQKNGSNLMRDQVINKQSTWPKTFAPPVKLTNQEINTKVHNLPINQRQSIPNPSTSWPHQTQSSTTSIKPGILPTTSSSAMYQTKNIPSIASNQLNPLISTLTNVTVPHQDSRHNSANPPAMLHSLKSSNQSASKIELQLKNVNLPVTWPQKLPSNELANQSRNEIQLACVQPSAAVDKHTSSSKLSWPTAPVGRSPLTRHRSADFTAKSSLCKETPSDANINKVIRSSISGSPLTRHRSANFPVTSSSSENENTQAPKYSMEDIARKRELAKLRLKEREKQKQTNQYPAKAKS